MLAQSLSPLVEAVVIYDPYQEQKFWTLPFLENFQVVILACSLNQQNYHWFDANFFAQLSSDVVLINAARGGLIVQEDLLHFLRARPQSFAYLDVFENGPITLPQLALLPNVRCTSHVAGVFTGLDQEVLAFEMQVLGDFFRAASFADFEAGQKGRILQQRMRGELLI